MNVSRATQASPDANGSATVAALQRRIADLETELAVNKWDADVRDGTAEIDPGRLADLAFERAHLGATWLARLVRPDGSFPYI